MRCECRTIFYNRFLNSLDLALSLHAFMGTDSLTAVSCTPHTSKRKIYKYKCECDCDFDCEKFFYLFLKLLSFFAYLLNPLYLLFSSFPLISFLSLFTSLLHVPFFFPSLLSFLFTPFQTTHLQYDPTIITELKTSQRCYNQTIIITIITICSPLHCHPLCPTHAQHTHLTVRCIPTVRSLRVFLARNR